MKFKPTELPGLVLIELEPFQDDRGFFTRIFCRREFSDAGLDADFVQTNHSITHQKGTVRGLHYQHPPDMEAKVIRCIRGAVYDVAVDLRKNSPTYLHYFTVELSESNNRMIYIPRGFAHGFQTLDDHTSLIYQHSAYYRPGAEGGLRYDDPAIGIIWPLPVTMISEKDRSYAYITPAFEGVSSF